MKNNYFSKASLIFCCLILACMAMWSDVNGQSAANYGFSTTTTGSFAVDLNSNAIDMTTGTTQLVAASSATSTLSSQVAIGFDFYVMGFKTTQFLVNTNGVLGFGSTAGGTTVGSGTSTTNTAIGGGSSSLGQTGTSLRISPLAGPSSASTGATASNGKIIYKLVGSAPTRTLVVEFGIEDL